jgi:hypothetical protein
LKKYPGSEMAFYASPEGILKHHMFLLLTDEKKSHLFLTIDLTPYLYTLFFHFTENNLIYSARSVTKSNMKLES